MDFINHGTPGQKILMSVLTGGPGSGKTTIAPWFAKTIPLFGWHHYRVPEAAAFLIEKQGLPVKAAWQNQDMNVWLECQRRIMTYQFCWEELEIYRAKTTGKFPALIDCDRGLLDNYGYILDACHHFGNPGEAFDMFVRILHEVTGLTFEETLMRYAVVVHMVTAADGARPFYTLANNVTRDEFPERAIELDRRMQQAWAGHPQHRIIDNSTDFEGKQVRVLHAICDVLGIPTSHAGA